jgi:hypothetical protein
VKSGGANTSMPAALIHLLKKGLPMLKRFVALLLLLFFTSACANQVAFLSTPAGAEVFVDGDQVGVTPCLYQYKSNSGREYEVVIKKEGYQAVEEKLLADQVDKSARKKWLTAGLVWSPLWLGTYFTKKLKDSYPYVLKRPAPVLNAQLQNPARDKVL